MWGIQLGCHVLLMEQHYKVTINVLSVLCHKPITILMYEMLLHRRTVTQRHSDSVVTLQ